MFILLGYLSIALVQLYRQYRRRTHYASTMLRALRNGSVLVQRGKWVQRSSAGALLNSSLLSCSQSYKESQLLSDEHLAVAVVSPKVMCPTPRDLGVVILHTVDLGGL